VKQEGGIQMKISEQENLDVARIMMLTARQKEINPSIAELLDRASYLLKQTTVFCTGLIKERSGK
jgi:hypothetical protein